MGSVCGCLTPHTSLAPEIMKKEQNESDNQAFGRLARLSPTQYDRVRKSEARHLYIRIETLDAEVAERRAQLHHQADSHPALSTLPPPIPWPEPVDGQEALSQTS